VPSSCAVLGGFSIGTWVSLLTCYDRWPECEMSASQRVLVPAVCLVFILSVTESFLADHSNDMAYGWFVVCLLVCVEFWCILAKWLMPKQMKLVFSECLSVICPSVVCNVRATYSGGSSFRQYFYGIRYLGHPLTSTENFTEIVPGEPLRWGS